MKRRMHFLISIILTCATAIALASESTTTSRVSSAPAHNDSIISSTEAIGSAAELLTNSGFEGSFDGVAPGWSHNNWAGVSVHYSRETSDVHGGQAAQEIRVTDIPTNAGLIFTQDHTFTAGRTFEGSVWLRSSDSVTVRFEFRRADHPYEAVACRTIQVGSKWQKLTIRGGFSKDSRGNFDIRFLSTGTLFVDDAELREIVTDTNAVASQDVIPNTFFGMHINKWGTYNTWPSRLNFGLFRMWDTATNWRDLEPSQGIWEWFRTDYYVNEARANDQEIIYTLGMTPDWAAARVNDAASEPKNMDDWRDYVRTVATRYQGKIKYYEIWNEANYSGFYSGTVAKMLELTRIAREELKSVDPSIVVLSPNITSSGLAWLDEFLFRGGGQYVDAISWHRYPALDPENDLPLIEGVRNLMRSYGIGDRPLWNTEGSNRKEGVSTSDELDRGLVARTYITEWASGISLFCWYAWDINGWDHVLLSDDTYLNFRAAGEAYPLIVSWLSGARMTERVVDGNTWLIRIERADGYVGRLLWNTSGNATFLIPSSWSVERKRDLMGGFDIWEDYATVDIGVAPILLESALYSPPLPPTNLRVD